MLKYFGKYLGKTFGVILGKVLEYFLANTPNFLGTIFKFLLLILAQVKQIERRCIAGFVTICTI